MRVLLLALLVVAAAPQARQARFTIDQVLSSPFPYNLVAARRADRIAWIENERGRRNVYTAVAPDFTSVRLTSTTEDGINASSNGGASASTKSSIVSAKRQGRGVSADVEVDSGGGDSACARTTLAPRRRARFVTATTRSTEAGTFASAPPSRRIAPP